MANPYSQQNVSVWVSQSEIAMAVIEFDEGKFRYDLLYSSIPLLSDNDSKITHITSRYKGIRIVNLAFPIGSMYAIYTNIWGILMVKVTIHSIHGSYGFLNKICMDRDANLATSAEVVRDITGITEQTFKDQSLCDDIVTLRFCYRCLRHLPSGKLTGCYWKWP